MNKKKFSIHKAFSILFLTVIIFAVGVLIGNQTSHQKVNTVLELSQELQLQTRGIEVQYDILEENICLNDDVLFLTEDLFDLSEKIGFMENTLGSENAKVQEMKKEYFIVEAKHWLLAKKRTKDCFQNNISMNNTVVLYFYSNKGDCPRCQQEGTVISYLHMEYEGMNVYSFDATSDSTVVTTLKQLYNIKDEMPALVINDETHSGFIDADEFIAIVDAQAEAIKLTKEELEV